MGRPEEIASVARFLLSADASFVTGQAIAVVLMVSGGWMLNQLVEFTRGLYELAPTLLR